MAILTPVKAQVFITVFIFLVTWLVVWSAIAFPLFHAFQWRPFQPISPVKKLALLLPLYLLAPLVIWGANHRLGQSWQTLGATLNGHTARSLVAGFGIAVVGLLLLLLLKGGFQLVTFTPFNSPQPTRRDVAQALLKGGVFLILGLFIGGIEELVFRGWIQTQLEIAMVPWLAASFGSALFALAHLIWDGSPGLRQQPGLWVLGWVFVVACWADDGALGLAWGLHAGWVWGLACISEVLAPAAVGPAPRWLVGHPDYPLTGVLDFSLMGMTAGVIGWTWGLIA